MTFALLSLPNLVSECWIYRTDSTDTDWGWGVCKTIEIWLPRAATASSIQDAVQGPLTSTLFLHVQ